MHKKKGGMGKHTADIHMPGHHVHGMAPKKDGMAHESHHAMNAEHGTGAGFCAPGEEMEGENESEGGQPCNENCE